MRTEELEAVRQVLSEAGNAPHFFDLSDAQRLNWMIARAFTLGVQHGSKRINRKGVPRHERPKQRRVA